jgi:predicted PurR-regulated permease PerM
LGRDRSVPIVLAFLISLLLAPVVARLERWGFRPVLAGLSVAAVAFAIVGALCTTLSVEALDLANSLPKYRDNIRANWVAIQKGPPGPASLAFRNVGNLLNDLSKVTASAKSPEQPEPMKVEVVSGTERVFAFVKSGMAR